VSAIVVLISSKDIIVVVIVVVVLGLPQMTKKVNQFFKEIEKKKIKQKTIKLFILFILFYLFSTLTRGKDTPSATL